MKRKNNRRGIMGCSNIPYAQRLKMQQESDIVNCRNHSAKIAMYIISVALHDVVGAGYRSLVRFARHHKTLVEEFYQDQDVGMAHCVKWMEELGMPISGEFFIAPPDGSTIRELEVKTNALQAIQIAMILGAISANIIYGLGAKRQRRLNDRIREISTRYNQEGQGFLLAEMAKLGFEVTPDGRVLYVENSETGEVMPAKMLRGVTQ